MYSTKRFTRNARKQVGGVHFDHANLEIPDEPRAEASRASSGADRYRYLSNDISTTDFGDLRYTPAFTPANRAALAAAGIQSEFYLFFLAVALHKHPGGLALFLRELGILFPVYFAELIYTKVSRLWLVPRDDTQVDMETDYLMPNIELPFELEENSKNAILEYIYQNIGRDQLKEFERIEITFYDLVNYVTNYHGSDALNENFISYLSADDLAYFKRHEILERIFRTYAVQDLPKYESMGITGAVLADYIREFHGGESAFENFMARLPKSVRHFLQDAAWKRRRHLIPVLAERYGPSNTAGATAALGGAGTSVPRRRHRSTRRRRNNRK